MASPSLAAPMKRERGTERPQSAVVQPSSNQTSEQELVETLRKKQTELDAKENKVASRNLSVPATTTQTEREQSEQRIRMIESQIKAQQRSIQKAPAIKGSTVNKAESLTPESEVYRVPKAADLNSKEARLDELLRKYRADEITPREYHMERAKIIAEP